MSLDVPWNPWLDWGDRLVLMLTDGSALARGDELPSSAHPHAGDDRDCSIGVTHDDYPRRFHAAPVGARRGCRSGRVLSLRSRTTLRASGRRSCPGWCGLSRRPRWLRPRWSRTAAPSPLFVVDTDPTGVYRFSGGTSFRIGRDRAFHRHRLPSPGLRVRRGRRRSPFRGVGLAAMCLTAFSCRRSGSREAPTTCAPKVMTAGDAYTPDVDGVRARVVAQASPTPTEDMTRTAFLLAIRKV